MGQGHVGQRVCLVAAKAAVEVAFAPYVEEPEGIGMVLVPTFQMLCTVDVWEQVGQSH